MGHAHARFNANRASIVLHRKLPKSCCCFVSAVVAELRRRSVALKRDIGISRLPWGIPRHYVMSYAEVTVMSNLGTTWGHQVTEL